MHWARLTETLTRLMDGVQLDEGDEVGPAVLVSIWEKAVSVDNSIEAHTELAKLLRQEGRDEVGRVHAEHTRAERPLAHDTLRRATVLSPRLCPHQDAAVHELEASAGNEAMAHARELRRLAEKKITYDGTTLTVPREYSRGRAMPCKHR